MTSRYCQGQGGNRAHTEGNLSLRLSANNKEGGGVKREIEKVKGAERVFELEGKGEGGGRRRRQEKRFRFDNKVFNLNEKTYRVQY